MMTKNEIITYIRSRREGELFECYGPWYIGSAEIWEVWVKDAGEFETRFVVSEQGKPPEYFSQFQQFCEFVSGRESLARVRAEEFDRQLGTAKNEHVYKLISLSVATTSFVVCVVALLYFIAEGVSADFSYLALLGGILASGGTMFFGNWKMPKIK